MVCPRCIIMVQQIMDEHHIEYRNIALGEVKLLNPLSSTQKKAIEKSFLKVGFEIIDDRNSRIIENIKKEILALIYDNPEEQTLKLSSYLSQKLHADYSQLSNLFSEVEGLTIERYFILQKIERVKELLVYDELTLTEIAYQLGYSSVAYLSNQFKKITGLTPSHFKKISDNKRQPIDKI